MTRLAGCDRGGGGMTDIPNESHTVWCPSEHDDACPVMHPLNCWCFETPGHEGQHSCEQCGRTWGAGL